ncbi:MAG: hypothetical protein CVV23_07440 [Ignavibacteriae bacterium HGW-Ignavibacteriae-2]|nr:MAG: hypothetical protein CVV23_07440 [Ignavibacteriae bacterium HGW-Ignavibacteriae-2]
MKIVAQILFGIFFINLFLCFTVSAQKNISNGVISGKVYDGATGDPIPNVNIFISGTTIGTSSDLSGIFKLSDIPFETVSLVVSCIGYKPEYRTQHFTKEKTKEIIFKMTPVTYDLPSVSVVGREDKKWQENFKLFQKEFLGENYNSQYSRIINPYDLELYKTYDGTLIAKSKKPLIIENSALGYKIIYTLQEFSSKYPITKFNGVTFFENLFSENESVRDEWNRQRVRTYLSSLQYFIKSLSSVYKELNKNALYLSSADDEDESMTINQKYLAKYGFEVRGTEYPPYIINNRSRSYPLNTNSILKEGISENELVVDFNNYLLVQWIPDKIDLSESFKLSEQKSFILLETGRAFMDAISGSVDEASIKTFGDFSKKRIADLMPLDYVLPDSVTAKFK